jgi:ABC-type Fe3+/spermidine/putrescine transport system ATPase subunit
LLRHIAGFYLPDEGSVWFGEQEVTRVPPYLRGTAMMFQSYALWPHLTVAENVAFGLEERRLPRPDISGRVAEALNVVQLGGLGERRIQQLSGGQQQRVALARALVVRPHCLLLDEPLSNLDAQLRLEMRSEIRRVCKEFDLTAVYVTHDQEEALSMADRLAVMVGGRLAQVGTPQAVYRNPVSRMVAGFIGETNLFRGQVLGPANRKDTVVVQTESGPMTARITIPDWRPGAGEAIWLSVRPEAIQLESSSAPNSFAGELIEAVYLGASAQYRLRLASGQMLCIAESNPAGMVRSVGQTAVASTSLDDLIVLPG